MTDAALAWRFAVAGGLGRAGLVVAGNAVGAAVVLLALAVPSALGGTLTRDDERFVSVVVVFLLMPVACLLASVARLSSSTRDRRLAALRLLGATARRTRRIAALEAAVLSLVGAAAGALLFAFVLRPVAERIDGGWRAWFAAGLAPPGRGWAIALIGVPVLSMAVSVVPVRTTARSALSVRRQGPAAAPRRWRLVPLVVGVVLLAWAVGYDQRPDVNPRARLLVPFFAGAVLTGLALPLVVPNAVRLIGNAAVRWGRSPSVLLAGRRLQQEPAGTTRLVAALLVAVFVVGGGRCVLSQFETVPQYKRAALADSTGPQLVQVLLGPGSDVDLDALRGVKGVREVVPARRAGTACTPDDPRGAELGGAPCAEAFIGTCAQLAAFSHGLSGCRDDRASWIDRGHGWPGDELPEEVRLIPEPLYGPDGRQLPPPPMPPVTIEDVGVLQAPVRSADPNWGPPTQLFVPASAPGIRALLGEPNQLYAVLDGGPAPLKRLQDAVPPGAVVHGEDLTDLVRYRGYEAVLFAVSAVVVAVGLLALLVSGIDQATARRRHLASLSVLGVPGRVIRRSQLLQAGAPLAVGLPLAGVTGLLAGAAFLNLVGARSTTPWPAVAALVVAAVAASLLVAAATVAGLGGRVRASDLRKE